MPNEMVERVARALYALNPYYSETKGWCESWEDCAPRYADALREDARAALQEVRVPTDGMILECVAAMRDYDPDTPFDILREEAERLWSVMLAAALSEEEGGDGQ